MLAQEIKAFITESGLKYSAVAEKINMPTNTFSALINGKRKMTADEYIAICRVLNVPLDTFAKEEIINAH